VRSGTALTTCRITSRPRQMPFEPRKPASTIRHRRRGFIASRTLRDGGFRKGRESGRGRHPGPMLRRNAPRRADYTAVFRGAWHITSTTRIAGRPSEGTTKSQARVILSHMDGKKRISKLTDADISSTLPKHRGHLRQTHVEPSPADAGPCRCGTWARSIKNPRSPNIDLK